MHVLAMDSDCASRLKFSMLSWRRSPQVRSPVSWTTNGTTSISFHILEQSLGHLSVNFFGKAIPRNFSIYFVSYLRIPEVIDSMIDCSRASGLSELNSC